MNRERGGVIIDLLAAIGVVVVALALIFGGCFGSAGASPRHRRPSCDQRYDDCDQGGSRNSKGRDGDDQRSGRDSCHSFCGNTVIVPVPGGSTTTTTTADERQR